MKKSITWLVVLILVSTQLSSSANLDSVVVSGCVNKKTLVLRIVDKCSSAERKITWNQQGPMGDDGYDGADGRDGINGKDGITGKDGINGVDGVDGKDGLDGKDGINGKDGVNGRDGVPGIAGPKGEAGKDGIAGKDGSMNTIYWAYIKPKDILASTLRKIVIVNSRNLGLPVGLSGQYFRFEASVHISTKNNAQAWVGCYWTTQATLEKDAGGWGDFDSRFTVGYTSTLTPRAVMFLSKQSDEVILVCSVSENSSITGGYVSAEAVNASHKGTIGD